jgi:histidinol phosphatase-like enzyme (inositol monophosphatase family)
MKLQNLLDVAIEAAVIGGRKTLAYYNLPIDIDIKADGTQVTNADRDAEAAILKHIRRHFPDHDVLAEESGAQAGKSGTNVRWIIDPLDGTKTFVRGMPLYGTLIGAEVDGKPAVGVIYLPASDELVYAATGLGCRWNGRPCQVSKVDTLAEACLLTTDQQTAEGRGPNFAKLAKQVKFTRTWGDCYGYVLVATGRAEIMVDFKANPWDIAAVAPIMAEAGGHLSSWRGEESIWKGDAIGTNAALWRETVKYLESAPK